MGVKIKQSTGATSTDKVVSFDKADFMTIEGTEKSFFNGKVKVVHKVQGEKLIADGKAKLAKGVDFEVTTDENRSVKDVKEKN